MAIDLRDDGLDLCIDPGLWLGVSDAGYHGEVATTTRIGLSRDNTNRGASTSAAAHSSAVRAAP